MTTWTYHLKVKILFFFNFKDDAVERAVKLTARERRFIKFASAEFDGQLYMTPQDFLDSVVEQEPRRNNCIYFFNLINFF